MRGLASQVCGGYECPQPFPTSPLSTVKLPLEAAPRFGGGGGKVTDGVGGVF